MPHNIAKLIDPSLIQNMIDGDNVNRPGKHLKAMCEPFQVPMVAAGNKFPEFDNVKGAQTRRWVMFVFETFIANKDTKLENTIIEQELPHLFFKCLKCYWNMVKDNSKADFWDICPNYFIENKEIGRVASNYVHRFLVADKNENKTKTSCFYVRKIVKNPRIATPIEDVKKMFSRYMKLNHETVKKTECDDNYHSTIKE
jgi:phage/plasmid-associated DNA primase